MGYPKYVACALRILSGLVAIYFVYKGLAWHALPAAFGLEKPPSAETHSLVSMLGQNLTLFFHWMLGIVVWSCIGATFAILCALGAGYIEDGIPEMAEARKRAEEAEARLARIERQLERRRAMRTMKEHGQDSRGDRSNDKSLMALIAGLFIGGIFF